MTKGFTLVEVLLVVLILAVLASIVIPRIAESAGDAKDAKCDANIANLRSALERYAVANSGEFPADNTDFQSDILNNTATFMPENMRKPSVGTILPLHLVELGMAYATMR